MARKSRKQIKTEAIAMHKTPQAVGYIRLSVKKEEGDSIENQKFIIELWGDRAKVPIAKYYVDNGYSSRTFRRTAFQEMI